MKSALKNKQQFFKKGLLCMVVFAFLGIPQWADADRRDPTDVELDTGRHAYRIWLDSVGEDHPMTVDEQTHYCSAAQEFAQIMWDATNGRHRIENVNFHYDSSEPASWDIRWKRQIAVQNSNTMYDRAKYCRNKWILEGDSLEIILADDPCPTGTECEPNPPAGRGLCLDNDEPFLASPQETGTVMAHETSHYNYDLDDEYNYTLRYLSSGILMPHGFAYCINPEHNVSMMATMATHWCDKHTHTRTQYVDGTEIVMPPPTGYGEDDDDSLWTQLKQGLWNDLGNYNEGASALDGEYVTDPAVPLTFESNFCTFSGTAFEDSVLADIIIAVDRSGSMNYEADYSVYTAFEGALAAGLEHYNLTGDNRKSGVLIFNHDADFLIEYDEFDDYVTVGDYDDLEATGSTNICEAIDLAASEFENSGVTDQTGVLLLLSDGLPTTSGCSEKIDVINAAQNACGEWGDNKQLGISAVAYGDADYELLNQITEMCGGGDIWAVDHDSPEQPFDLHLALSRAAYRNRTYKEAIAIKEETASTNEHSFYVPEGTQELVVSWIGESYGRWISVPGAEFVRTCTFRQIEKSLLDPNGDPQGVEVVPEDIEEDYYTKTLRVLNPDAGEWTMAAGADFECVDDNYYYNEHVPMLGQIAYLKGSPAVGTLKITPEVAKLDEPVVIEATLNLGDFHLMTDLTVSAQVSIGNNIDYVTMRDDGAFGDPVANDGVYTGIFNEIGPITEPGIRRVLVTMSALPGQAQTIIRPGVHTDSVEPEPAVPVSVTIEESLYLKDCGYDTYGELITDCTESCGIDEQGNPVAGCNMSHCEFDENDLPIDNCLGIPGQVVCTNNPFSVNPGETVYGLELLVRGHAVGSRRVSVNLGAGIRTFVTETSYDADKDESTIVFNATATSNSISVSGDMPVSVGFAGKIFRGVIALCDTSSESSDGERGIYVTNSITASDRVHIDCPAIQNVGYGQTHLGVESITGTVESNGPVSVANNATILGGIYTASTVSFSDINTVDIADGYHEYQDLTFEDLGPDSLDWVVFPQAVELPPLNPQPDPYILPPASYPDVYLNSGVTILLSGGTYYFNRLIVNSAAQILIDDTPGDVEIFVAEGLSLTEPIMYEFGDIASVYIGYTGTAPVSIEAAFDGALIAPNAQVTMGTATYHLYGGSFVAKDLILGPDAHLICSDTGGTPNPGESCYDNLLNQDETDTDCGGVCPGCDDGSPCNDDDDCLSDNCAAGICSSSSGGCDELSAIDMGWHGKTNTVPNDACLMIRNQYPDWWGVRNVQIQPMAGGSYPLPYTWSSSCMSSSGSGAFQASWLGEFFGPTSDECATIIDLGGDGSEMISLRYWGV